MFCLPENIDREMSKLFARLVDQQHLRELDAREFALRAAHFLADSNAIHRFREGNGRTQLTLLILLAEAAGHPLDFEQLNAEQAMQAKIDSFQGNENPLVTLIYELTSNQTDR